MSDTQQLGLAFSVPSRKVYPVRELVAAVRTQLERTFTDLWVEGEISNYRPVESGHLYFSLKDASAQLRVVMWRTQARLLRFRLENGLQVIARGRVTLYDERGDLQFQAEYLEPKGAGALQVAFEQLKARLAAEGLFDQTRRKAIPALPRRIGVVTSPRGAALQDILNILRRRHESVNVLIYPAQVQGEAAAGEVSAGVRYFGRHSKVDVIIIARGGGSFEDLFAFNDEGLARVIAASEIPVISAVGHETDFTICDFVADLRAPTPSAAAELVIRSKQDLSDKLATLRKRLAQTMNYKLLRSHNRLSGLERHPVFARMQDSVARRLQRLDDLVFRLSQAHVARLKSTVRRLDSCDTQLRRHDPRLRLAATRRQLEADSGQLRASIARLLAGHNARVEYGAVALRRAGEAMLPRRRARWERLHTALQALSPEAILARGYALVFDEQGKVVKQAGRLSPGDIIRGRLAQGEFTAQVAGTSEDSGTE